MILTFEERIRQSLAMPRVAAWSAGIFGAITLVLALFGIIVSIFTSVSERQREFVARLALGASLARVRRLVLRQVGVVAVAGIAAGVSVAIVALTFLRSLLFEAGTLDSAPVAILCAALLVLTLGAARLAVWRTTRGDLWGTIRDL